jgi:hypothetical protein
MIKTKIDIPNLYYNNSVSFCFLVTRDLSKEHIWKKWFDKLKEIGLKYNIYVHCSKPNNIKSKWLQKYLIPYNIPTAWDFHMEAELELLNHALVTTNDSWFINLSETTVPFISPKKFKKIFDEYKTNTILGYRRPWWDVEYENRANLSKFPKKARYGNGEWCVICNEDMRSIAYVWNNTDIVTTMMEEPHADESIFAVTLYIIPMNLKMNIQKKIRKLLKNLRKMNRF